MMLSVTRRVAIPTLSILIALLAAGCGLFGAEPEPTPEPVELSFLTFDLGGMWGRAEEMLIEQFESAHPNVTVDRSPYAQAPVEYLNTPPQPDIMVITAGHPLDRAVAQGQLVELTDVWDQSGLGTSYPPGFRRMSEYDGKQFFAPIGYTWSGLYYSKPIFEQLGLQPPATWDELLAACTVLYDNAIYPIAISGDDSWMALLWFDYLDLRLNGPDFHRQLVSGEVSFEDPQVLAVLDLWSQLFANDCVIENPGSVNSLEAQTLVASDDENLNRGRQAGMVLTNPSWLGDVPESMRADLGFVPFPVIDPSQPIGEIMTTYGYMVPVDAPQRELATEFAALAVSPAAQDMLGQQINGANGLVIPANPGEDQSWMDENTQRGMEIVQRAEAVFPLFMLSIPDSMWPAVEVAVGSFMRDPTDVAGFAAKLEAARQKALAAGAFLPAE